MTQTIYIDMPMGRRDVWVIPAGWKYWLIAEPVRRGWFELQNRRHSDRSYRVLRAAPTGEVEVRISPDGVSEIPIWRAEYE